MLCNFIFIELLYESVLTPLYQYLNTRVRTISTGSKILLGMSSPSVELKKSGSVDHMAYIDRYREGRLGNEKLSLGVAHAREVAEEARRDYNKRFPRMSRKDSAKLTSTQKQQLRLQNNRKSATGAKVKKEIYKKQLIQNIRHSEQTIALQEEKILNLQNAPEYLSYEQMKKEIEELLEEEQDQETSQ